MVPSSQVIAAIIGVAGTLAVFLIKDIILYTATERRKSRRELLQARLEHAYVPLEHLSFMLIRTDDPQSRAQLTEEINTILRQYGHLLSEQSLSAFYLLLDDTNAGADMLQHSFYAECAHLKDSYYEMWYSRREALAQTQGPTSNQTDNIHVDKHFAKTQQETLRGGDNDNNLSHSRSGRRHYANERRRANHQRRSRNLRSPS